MCGKPCKILSRFQAKAPKVKEHFSGNTPPEIFVGRVNYPNVFSGILSPTTHEDSANLASPEEWVSKGLSIEEILEMRGQLVYGRGMSHIKSSNSLKKVTQELALSSKPVSTEFFLKKRPVMKFTPSKVFSIMTNPAPLKKVLIEENVKVDKKVDYLVGDYDVKSVAALGELYDSKIQTSHLQKLLSVGLLGVKASRRMVPTRWSITAVDDTLSKRLLEKIRYYPELEDIKIFHSEFNGNHYEILLLPGRWGFEVIEATTGFVYDANAEVSYMQDYEGFYPRKTYASNVTGAYYANRLGVAEYLGKIKRQATVLVLREVRPEYYAPLGVGILREATRRAFIEEEVVKGGEVAENILDALRIMQERMRLPIEKFEEISWILQEYGKQKSLKEWF